MFANKESLDRLVSYLPFFEDEGTEKYVISDTAISGPYVYTDKVKEFIQALQEEDFLQEFDWEGWRDEAHRYLANRDLIDTADSATVARLFTVIVRLEVIIHGVLAEMIDKGVVAELLQRLKNIRAEGANGQ